MIVGVAQKHVLLTLYHPVGGIRTYLRYTYSRDVFREFRFSIIAPDDGFAAFCRDLFGARLAEFVPVQNSLSLMSQAWSHLHRQHVDLVHSHGFTAGVLTSPAVLYSEVPHLMTAHDIFQEKQFAGFKGVLKRKLLSTVLRRIDAIHVPSRDTADNLLQHIPGLKETRLILIEHGIDTVRFFDAPPRDLHDEVDKNCILLGFFGRFMSQKGFRCLVDAVGIIVREGLSGKTPLVLTFGEGGFVREDYAYLEDQGLARYFRRMPHTDDMPGTIKGVDMVVMPSIWEACGLLGIEALVAGVPIVGTTCAGLREVLDGTPAATVPPGDARALAEAIAAEMNAPRRDEFLRYAGQAKERFSAGKPAAELARLYQRMLSEQPLA